jgi:hypothetical protein
VADGVASSCAPLLDDRLHVAFRNARPPPGPRAWTRHPPRCRCRPGWRPRGSSSPRGRDVPYARSSSPLASLADCMKRDNASARRGSRPSHVSAWLLETVSASGVLPSSSRAPAVTHQGWRCPPARRPTTRRAARVIAYGLVQRGPDPAQAQARLGHVLGEAERSASVRLRELRAPRAGATCSRAVRPCCASAGPASSPIQRQVRRHGATPRRMRAAICPAWM